MIFFIWSARRSRRFRNLKQNTTRPAAALLPPLPVAT